LKVWYFFLSYSNVVFLFAEAKYDKQRFQLIIVLERSEIENVAIDVSYNARRPVVTVSSHSTVSLATFLPEELQNVLSVSKFRIGYSVSSDSYNKVFINGKLCFFFLFY